MHWCEKSCDKGKLGEILEAASVRNLVAGNHELGFTVVLVTTAMVEDKSIGGKIES